MSILNVYISKFDSVRDTENPVDVNLLDWLKIGFALAEVFGESGRVYFHQV